MQKHRPKIGELTVRGVVANVFFEAFFHANFYGSVLKISATDMIPTSLDPDPNIRIIIIISQHL